MKDDRSPERTETDERVAENQTPAPVASTAGGNDGASPLDRGEPLDPFGGKAPSERIDALKPGEAQRQAFGSVNDPIEE
jgi:hypothetical protein